MQTRRKMMTQSAAVPAVLSTLPLAAGLYPGWAVAQTAAYNTAAFEAKSMGDVMKALGSANPVESKDIAVTGPDIAENGAVVPIGASTALAGVKRMLVLIEKNPSLLAAMFEVTDAVDANFSTRVKMGQSSNILAVAMMNDGRAFYAQKEVKVTLGGCGG